MEFAAFCTGTSPFYEHRGSDSRALHLSLPPEWRYAESDGWIGVWTSRAARRTHGWKIHLSLHERAFERALHRVADVCLRHEATFKYVPTVSALNAKNAKNADRAASGKAVTIYPESDEQLGVLAEELNEALDGLGGPYILSDVRFRGGPVHFRHGGFESLFIQRDGQRVAASPRADGTLVPDVRAPYFLEPDDVPVPAVVAEAIDDYRRVPPSNPLAAYETIEPIQFSNAGGVYRAVDGNGQVCLLKEARGSAGIDANGRHAVDRLGFEYRNLTRLRSSSVAPRPIRLFEVLEHTFLEMEFLEGQTLADRTVSELPALLPPTEGPELHQRYARTSTVVVRSLFDAIERTHRAGVAIGDLHPGNVMVGADLHVKLIDLEDGRDPDDSGLAPFNALGYGAPEGWTARQADWFAFTRTVASMFDPSFARELLAADHWEQTLARIQEAGGSAVVDLIAKASKRFGRAGSARAFETVGVTAAAPAPAELGAALHAGIRSARRAGDPRRFPGDPRGLVGMAQVSCGYGLGGVLLAQLRAGDQPEAEDVDFLAGAATLVDRVGAFDGAAGLAYVLAETGRPEEAAAALERLRALVPASDDCSLATGLSGVALATASMDDGYSRDVAELIASRVLAGEGSAQLNAHPGLLGGWSGVALALARSARYDSSGRLREAALTAIVRDCDQVKRSTAGTIGLREPGGARVFPYLANGTAGVLLALTELRREGVLGPDDALWKRNIGDLVRSCSGGAHVFDGLFHGAAGLLVALRSAVAYWPEAEEPVGQLTARLARRTFRWNGTTQVAGDGCVRLSSDLATGAAGVALSLPTSGGPLAWIPARTALVPTDSEGR